MKDEISEKILTKYIGLRAQIYRYVTDDGREDKKLKGTKKCAIKRKLNFENYKNCLEVSQLENKISHLEKNTDLVSFFFYNRK